ncbi:MAG TPA: M48 family metalloprotease [Luteimonas sp.]|jgi:Zn-dependent protease with chaperone function|nr:M48 family metalloprotease [Luteimonas sp.]
MTTTNASTAAAVAIGRRAAAALLACAAAVVLPAVAATMTALVHKPSVDVRSAPDFKAAAVATLQRDAKLEVAGQQGLWFAVKLEDGRTGYVRVNDVRMAYAADEGGDANVRALFTGKAGKGRVTETAGVRGLDESSLASAGYDAGQLAAMEGNRVAVADADAQAATDGWVAMTVPYAAEATTQKPGGATQKAKRGGFGFARTLLSMTGVGSALGDSALNVAEKSMGKSEEEMSAEELALGPEIAGRVLGAAPLWDDQAAQHRVNVIGRWVASHTSRPDLPWTFGVIDSPEINAFAAPGGYILMTRGMYELLADDGEVAAVLGHEIGHVVQRDHYTVIHKQEVAQAGTELLASQVNVGGGLAGQFAKDYVTRNGAKVLLTSLDREAEFRADQASEVYLARSGFDPLSLYAVLQKMTAFGTKSAALAELYKTHPPLADRLDRIDTVANPGVQAFAGR